ncbi:signal peptidase I [Enterococcus sp. BWM-S5]|uniref:Signal peptidase I n=1 Tax=Enterococcus larvae TaxID=2794352 RepID=A0ABS4CMQ1_9ENTE|nr:signal peptidase I [Enterococcus larvae]
MSKKKKLVPKGNVRRSKKSRQSAKKATAKRDSGNLRQKKKASANTRKRKLVQRKRKTKKNRKRKTRRTTVMEILLALGISLLLFFAVFQLLLSLPKVEGYSMTPTTNDQDRLLVYKWGTIRRFSLIYFQEASSEENLVRRVIGLPGEELYYKNGSLFVNGNEIPERFLSTGSIDGVDELLTEDFTLNEATGSNRVPEDCYFVMGDNRSYATDSRYFGFVKKKEIIGVVKARIFPIHAMRQF